MSFYTDVIAKSPQFKNTARVADVMLLEPGTRAAVAAIIKDAKDLYHMDLMVFETYRSAERQLQLFNQGASKLKNVGVHHYGLACDIVKEIGGSPSWKGDFTFLGPLAKSHGLIWGGDWGYPHKPHGFVDADHVQRCTVDRQPGLFKGAWYPDAQYDPYKEL